MVLRLWSTRHLGSMLNCSVLCVLLCLLGQLFYHNEAYKATSKIYATVGRAVLHSSISVTTTTTTKPHGGHSLTVEPKIQSHDDTHPDNLWQKSLSKGTPPQCTS